ncbi:MAG: type II toxin-antitoxin system RelE/ParE family toxin [Bacteroidota bacterium]|nr:type II toxin-antitoxin system RelE/ParE family toxin [Bacteroidota bacterium]
MTNVIKVSHAFKRDVKPLAKKHRSLKTSVDNLIAELTQNAFLGDHYGNDIYKVRLADKSKGTGKSGGFRVLYYHLKKTEDGIEVLLIAIYDKSERSTIKKNDAVKKLKEILAEHDREQNV